jgi:hypothetical protein
LSVEFHKIPKGTEKVGFTKWKCNDRRLRTASVAGLYSPLD